MLPCRALLSPPSVGYSQQCLLGRGSALKRAVETLLDSQVGAGPRENGRCGLNRGIILCAPLLLPLALLCRQHSAASPGGHPHNACACPVCLPAQPPARRYPCPASALQSRKAYDDALRTGAITENVPDEFVPGMHAKGGICGCWMAVG